MSGVRILTVAPPYQRLPSQGYGAIERIVIERGQALAKAGAIVDVVAPRGSRMSFASRVFEIDEVALRDFHKTGSPVIDAALFLARSHPIRYSVPYIRLPSLEGYDCVLNDAFRSEPWIAALMASSIGWSRVISVLHANAPRWTALRPHYKLRDLVLGALNLHTLKWLENRGWRTVHIPNGIAFPANQDFDPNPQEYLVFIGRISREKGADRAIEIALRVGIPLHVYGKVQDREFFERRIEPRIDGRRIIFFGEVARPILETSLRSALALLFTSTWSDPYPTVLLEAFRFGVPVLAIRPGWFSGFYDVCNTRNSVVGNSIEEAAKSFGAIRDLSRQDIFNESRARFSWDNVVRASYVGSILRVAGRA